MHANDDAAPDLLVSAMRQLNIWRDMHTKKYSNRWLQASEFADA